MKLNPEDLVVETFDPTADAALATDTAIVITDDPNHPTPQTYCFVCDDDGKLVDEELCVQLEAVLGRLVGEARTRVETGDQAVVAA